MLNKIISLAIFCVLVTPPKSLAQNLFNTASDPLVGAVLNSASKEIQKLLAEATKDADYVLEKNLARLSLIIDNLQNNLSRELDKRFSQLSRLEKEAFNDLNEVAQNTLKTTSKKFLEAEEFLAMDVSTTLGQIPFFKKKLYISSIEGIGQKFRISGFYQVTIKGTAFGFETNDSIQVNGKAIQDFIPGRSSVTFNIPVEIINDKFQDQKISRVEFSIRAYSKSKKGLLKKRYKNVYTFKGKLLLLPKLPVTKYKLILSTNSNRWSKEEYDGEEGHSLVQAAPGDQRWAYGTITASVPPGCLLLKDKVTARVGGDLGWTVISSNYTFNEDKNTVTTDCKHQWEDRSVDFYLRCKYKKPIMTQNDSQATLEYMGRKQRNGLPYGTFLCKLPATYGFFVLEISLFNGEKIVFTPDDVEKSGITAKVKSAGGDFKNLVVEVKDE